MKQLNVKHKIVALRLVCNNVKSVVNKVRCINNQTLATLIFILKYCYIRMYQRELIASSYALVH